MARVILQCRPSSHQFNERSISLTEPVKIGRAVAGCKPMADNGYFNCKVLSRNHAVIWYEDGKFFLQDTQSSNGTFVNSQKLPTVCTSTPSDSQTSQGTLKDDQKGEGRKEILSGDVVQFGVEVLEQAKKGTQPVTHGCIVANLKLFHPDGIEAKRQASNKFTIIQAPSECVKGDDEFPAEAPKLSVQEIYELQTILQEANHRQMVLESKLAALNKILAAMEQKDTWSAAFQEDLLLSKIQYLEGRLRVHESQPPSKEKEFVVDSRSGADNITETRQQNGDQIPDVTTSSHVDSAEPSTFLTHVRDATLISDDYKMALVEEWKNMLEERSAFEMIAKDAIQKALADKLNAVKALVVTEERLHLAQNECGDLSSLCQCTQKDLLQLVEKFTIQSRNLDELTRTYQESERVKLECLDALRADKQRLEEQMAELHEKLEGQEDFCTELKRQNEKLLRRSGIDINGHWIGEKFNGVLINDGSSRFEDDIKVDNLRDLGSGSEDELLPQHPTSEFLSKLRQKTGSGGGNSSVDNIFQGKNVAQLVKEMQDMDSDEDDAPVVSSGEANLHSSIRESGQEEPWMMSSFPANSRIRNDFHDPDHLSTRVLFEKLPTVDVLKGSRFGNEEGTTNVATAMLKPYDKADAEMDQLLEGNERLGELVTRLQHELLAEREKIHLLTSRLESQHASGVSFVTGSLNERQLSTSGSCDEKGRSDDLLNNLIQQDQPNQLTRAVDELNSLAESARSATSVFQPASFFVFWNSHDPVAIGVLLLFSVWLCSVLWLGA